jgi:hypothetical protein
MGRSVRVAGEARDRERHHLKTVRRARQAAHAVQAKTVVKMARQEAGDIMQTGAPGADFCIKLLTAI